MPNEYDISKAFKRIENDLMDSMMRNLKRHQVEEATEGKEWEQWQAIQLSELEEYRKKNAKMFTGDFSDIQDKIDDMFYATYNDAQSAEEHRLMDRIKKGDFVPTEDKGGFFRLNEPKLNALIMATQADFSRAEYALLRRANDQYRQIIFDAMTYANVTNDYKKAVDMATHDFLQKGINCIQYKNGARHTIEDYASMALRTGNKRAYLMGEGNAHDRYGLHTVRVNKRTQACPLCVGFLGKILIDDVYAGGTRAEATAQGIPTLSDAMQAGFLHPNCKDMYSVYIEGVSKPSQPWSEEEISEIVGDYNQEQAIQHAEDMQETYQRMAKYSLDPENQAMYQTRADNWQARADELRAMPSTPVAPTIPQPMPQPQGKEVTEATPSKFIPAKTIEEAEQFAQSFCDTSRFGAVGISYEGVSVDVANVINKTISDFYEAYDVEPFGGIIAPKGNTKLGKQMADATAGYAPIRHSFLLNRKSLKDIKTAEKKLKAEREVLKDIFANPDKYDMSKVSTQARRVIENAVVSGRATIPMTIEEVLWHELGHSLEKQIAKTPYYDAIKASMKAYAPKVSGYATDTLSEYIAESFCSYKKGEGIIAPELEKAFEAIRR